MPHTELDDDVMRCFEEVTAILASKPDAPIDMSVVTVVMMAVGEALCLQIEKNRRKLSACHDVLERMLDMQRGAADCESAHSIPADHDQPYGAL